MAASKDDIVPVTKLIDNFDAGYDYITNSGTLFYFQTNKDAPRYNDEPSNSCLQIVAFPYNHRVRTLWESGEIVHTRGNISSTVVVVASIN